VIMASGKTLFHRFTLKQKLALVRKTKAVKTLQDELDRAANVRNQLAEIAGGMSVPEGETTMRHLRSASWYGNQVHEQLKTISNRTEFLSEEVESHRREAAKARHQHSRAAERSEADDQARQLAREARFDALMPPMRRR
tara:strand:- start:466 stop:882 length:417 start_codon:yes stop_codon:yes gene_type:complete